MQSGWLLLATASVLAVALTKAARWQALLAAGQPPARHVPLRPVFQVLLIGQMLNIVVPVRVGEIARHLPVSRPAVSQHLRVLKEAGLVRDRKDGNRRLYSVEPEGLEDLHRYLEGLWDSALHAFAVHVDTDTEHAEEGRRS